MTDHLPSLRQTAEAAAADTNERVDPDSLYPIYHTIPVGCGVHELEDDRMYPLFNRGDCIVVDHTDRAFVEGEIFLLLTGSPKPWQVGTWRHRPGVNTGTKEWCIRMDPINRPGGMNDIHERSRQGHPLYASDGPLKGSAWDKYCLGRVVGIYHNPRRPPYNRNT